MSLGGPPTQPPPQPGIRPIFINLPVEWERHLEVLLDPEQGLVTVEDVLLRLADHAQQGVYRPGSWERDWVVQAMGSGFEDRLEPDPDRLDMQGQPIFQRPTE